MSFLKFIRSMPGFSLVLLGLAGTPDDIIQWSKWLDMINHDLARWAFVILGVSGIAWINWGDKIRECFQSLDKKRIKELEGQLKNQQENKVEYTSESHLLSKTAEEIHKDRGLKETLKKFTGNEGTQYLDTPWRKSPLGEWMFLGSPPPTEEEKIEKIALQYFLDKGLLGSPSDSSAFSDGECYYFSMPIAHDIRKEYNRMFPND